MNRTALCFLLAASLLAACVKTNTATDIVLKPGEKNAEMQTPDPAGSPEPAATPAATAKADAKPDEKKVPVYLLRDTGKRCFAAPCPSWAAVNVDTRTEREITGIDLSALALDPKAQEAVRQRVLTGLVWVRGEIKTVPKQGPAGDGTVLAVSAIVENDEAPAP
jgi:hypothetical protein